MKIGGSALSSRRRPTRRKRRHRRRSRIGGRPTFAHDRHLARNPDRCRRLRRKRRSHRHLQSDGTERLSTIGPLKEVTQTFTPATARRGQTATLLPNGRVLISGGIGPDDQPLSSVELVVPGAGFVSERVLALPRSEHVAVPLCDGNVLIAGGGTGAEIYTPSVQ